MNEHDNASHERSASPVDQLLINEGPANRRIDRARLRTDARNAKAVGELCCAVLGRRIDGHLYFDSHGTWVGIASEYPFFPEFEFGGTLPLTSLIPRLNEWLRERAEISQSTCHPETALVASDAMFGALGSQKLLRTMLDLAGSEERQLIIKDKEGRGGVLYVPPRTLLVSSTTASDVHGESSGTIVGLTPLTEVVTSSGTSYLLTSSTVAAEVRAGAPARLRHPKACAVWRLLVSEVDRVLSEEERSV